MNDDFGIGKFAITISRLLDQGVKKRYCAKVTILKQVQKQRQYKAPQLLFPSR